MPAQYSKTSICGLGQIALSPVVSVLNLPACRAPLHGVSVSGARELERPECDQTP